MNGWLPVIAGIGSAVAGGFYLAFSAVVMPALRGQPAAEAIATMVSINEKAVRPPFTMLVNVPLNNRLSRNGGGRPERNWHS